jgi:hypothetical protein
VEAIKSTGKAYCGTFVPDAARQLTGIEVTLSINRLQFDPVSLSPVDFALLVLNHASSG